MQNAYFIYALAFCQYFTVSQDLKEALCEEIGLKELALRLSQEAEKKVNGKIDLFEKKRKTL